MRPRRGQSPLLAAGAALACVAVLGCRRPPPPKVTLPDVERCEQGIDRAIAAATRDEGIGIYYEECAGAYPECRDTLLRAAKAPHEERLGLVVEGCRRAYCPLLGTDSSLLLCQPGYEPRKETLERDWGPLHDAILAHSAKGYAPRLTKGMLRLYQRNLRW